ncbi:MAG: hypothetical protein JO235_19735, partial [Chroococcidiopsidaceae cyanobacterium CP_BM_RX_35]|nr:hypothetical protein [Chroococcidiopsidaceae cyanobacterium CP_BM_RX_35]
MSNAKKRLIGLIVIPLLLSTLLDISQASPSRGNLPFLSQADVPTAQKEAGLEFEGFGTPNTGTITRTIFQGECSGEDPGSIKARFYSTTTPPGADRRVVIRNVSRGIAGDTAPYTDREYNKGRTSQATTVAFGTSHKQQYFAVLEGLNNFLTFHGMWKKRHGWRMVYANCPKRGNCLKWGSWKSIFSLKSIQVRVSGSK